MNRQIPLFKPLLLASSIALAACGGSSGGGETTTSVSGKVADGYLNGATVCLDLNNNKICDAGEPSATSGAGGSFNLTATQAQIDSSAIIVEVDTNTIDEDTNTAITQPYVMSAPAGSDFVSPLTTMVQTKIDANPSLSVAAAEAAVKGDLGTTLSLFEDYIASAKDSANVDAAEFKQLHNIARVTAYEMAENYAAVLIAAANTDLDILIQIIVSNVIAELSNIVTAVENAGANFDEGTVTTISGTVSNTDLTTLEDVIAQIEEEQANPDPEVSNLLALLQSGLNWIDSWEDGFEYGVISADQDNNVSDLIYVYNNDMWEQETSSGPIDEDLILTTTGWANGGSLSLSVTVAADGSLQFNNGYDLDKITGAVEVDISGQNIATIDPDFPADAVDTNATFSTGAIGYQLTGLDKEVYGIGYWNDGQCTVLSASGNGSNCVSVHDSTGQPATNLASTIGHVHWLGDDLIYTLEGTGTDTNGIVSYEIESTGTSLTSSTWSLQTINSEELIVLDIPATVQPLTYDGDYATKAFHTVYDGFVRLGWYEAGGVFEALLFNDVAMQDILDNFIGGGGSSNSTSISGAYTDGAAQPFMVVFYPNGFYIHYQDCTDTQDGIGVEYGTYDYDGTTFSSNPIVDENGGCGLSEWQSFPVTVDASQLTFEENGQPYALPKVDGGSGSIVGAWNVGGSTNDRLGLVFYEDGTYTHWQDDSVDANCAEFNPGGGVEYGTYTFDGSTLTATQTVDENATCGLSDGASFNVTVTGGQMDFGGDLIERL